MTPQEQDAAIEQVLAFDPEYNAVRQGLMDWWKKDRYLLWNGETPKAPERAQGDKLKDPAEAKRVKAHSPAYGVNSKGNRSHRKVAIPGVLETPGESAAPPEPVTHAPDPPRRSGASGVKKSTIRKKRPGIRRGPIKCPEYLAWLRQQPCWACEYHEDAQFYPTESAHIGLSTSRRGLGQKYPDLEAVPLCTDHHRGSGGIHEVGPNEFFATRGATRDEVILKYQNGFTRI